MEPDVHREQLDCWYSVVHMYHSGDSDSYLAGVVAPVCHRYHFVRSPFDVHCTVDWCLGIVEPPASGHNDQHSHFRHVIRAMCCLHMSLYNYFHTFCAHHLESYDYDPIADVAFIVFERDKKLLKKRNRYNYRRIHNFFRFWSKTPKLSELMNEMEIQRF